MTVLALRPESDVVLARVRVTAEEIGRILDVQIASAEAEHVAGDLLRGIATLRREADDARKLEKAPHLAAGRDVDARFADACGPLERVEGLLRARLSARAAEREEARRLAVQAAAVATHAGDAVTANDALALAGDPVFAPVALDGIAETYTWEIDACDVTTMPTEYLTPDVAKIRAKIAEAKRHGLEPQIPGVRFRRAVSLVVRGVK